jgi:glycosyltransferase involved in cell wall biosynthesis
MGTPTTGEYLKDLSSVFTKILAKYSNVLIEIVGFEFREFDNSRLINKEWSLATEVEDLRSFDIGIMPLPYNEWANGKCGFKAILYMSVGKPCVCSAVGVNKEIIIDGFNGFLATTEQEWLDRLSLLIERSELRTNIAAAASETVEERYSLKNKSTKFLKVVREAAMPMVG